MTSETINVSTGPVHISQQVLAALASAPVSHRSADFLRLYYNTTQFLCTASNTSRCYLLTGSGTAANEAMICQIKMFGGKGLILSNGEFGERLIRQGTRWGLTFHQMSLAWGEQINLTAFETRVKNHEIKWVFFCHCETSTGVMNDLEGIAEICKRYSCQCFADCMSTVGTYSLDLSNVTMASASSGKGLASIPGLAILFSNIEPAPSGEIPFYFDLSHYKKKDGVPYTISSNLVHALNVSVRQKLNCEQFELIEDYSQRCFSVLNDGKILLFHNPGSRVFTMSSPANTTKEMAGRLLAENIVCSCESEYLRSRDWCQIALFGYYKEAELKRFIDVLKRIVAVPVLKSRHSAFL
ncbi:alanine--glyoxylate aminotransferase family protein [Segetibacter sp. 3557_3]|uniref:aminotransferase class V-fold PLP-dependent enzyme n=1 Tax=Segetibacter sp. 3557_3 TaxID=2547429 RepID=UPI001058A584|nr:aminotransferase class V-fold PLP-dependent enzyme [Segetibacter sp. 3557_3]TDH24607.1 alanine--glyoxylate aminotransferase family protein [Segetibacter sp. 3557_3]